MQDGTLQGVIENLPDAYVHYDAAGRLVAWNRKFRDLYPQIAAQLKGGARRIDLVAAYAGSEPSPIVNRDPREWLRQHLADIEAFRPAADRELLDGRWIRTTERRTDDGGIVCLTADITDLVKRVDEMKDEEARFRDFAGAASDLFWEMDEDLRFTQFLDEAGILSATEREQFLGSTLREILNPDIGDEIWMRHQKILDARQPFRDFRHSIIGSDPLVRHLSISGRPVFDGSGAFTGYRGAAADITARIEAQEAARKREALLRAIVEHLPARLTLKDLEGRYQLVNSECARFFGRPTEQIIGKTNADLTISETEAIVAHERKVIETRISVVENHQLDNADGAWHARVTKFPVFDDEGEVVGIGTIAIDTTEQNKIEEQLRQAQKMEAVGQLTGGIAHDFNNLLGIVIGNLDLLEENFKVSPAPRELIATANRAALHGAELTRQLLAFSRQQSLTPKTLDLNRQIRGMLELLRSTLGESIEVELVRGGGLWLCEADPSQVETALLNLAINARDAMPVGGALTVETANVRLDSAYADARIEVVPGQYVMLAVTDTGAGMPTEITQRAFEPFFTTKNVGEGSGLGLSMVFGFAKQSGGHVAIYSEEGHGTTVKLYLPRALQAANQDTRLPAATAPTGHGELILVVEDNDDLRELTVKQLRDLGYETAAARDGKTALDAFDAAGHIDLLLTDVILPGGMGGAVLAHEIGRRQPGVKVLYMSGYTENAIVHQGRLDPGVTLLQKPFRKTDLARMTHALLTAKK